MRICQACGGVIGRDCYNPQECMEITRQQAEMGQRIHGPYIDLQIANEELTVTVKKQREEIASLEKKLADVRDGVRYWTYCTDSGMRRECPEKVDELCDFLMSLGIAPYSDEEMT